MTLKSTTIKVLFLFVFSQQMAFAQQSAYGVNLSGLEWGTVSPPNAAELTYYAGKGLKLIRLPFLWERMQTSLGGSLSTSYLTTIDNFVASANTAGVSVILDMHNYCRYPYNGSIINSQGGPTIAQYASAWKLIAQHYANAPAVWGYDIMNEPNNLGTGNYWFPMAQAAIDSIRKVDTKKVLVVEGDFWSHGDKWLTYNDIANNKMSSLKDPNNNMIFEAHQYFDSDGSGTFKSTSFSGNGANTSTGVKLITPFVNWLKANNLKGMVGEFGIPNNNTADQANWNSLLDNFLAYLQTNCVMGTYWAGGSGWAYPNYVIGIDPYNGTDAPQMAIVQKYTTLASTCANATITGFDNAPLGAAANAITFSPNPFSDNTLITFNINSNSPIAVQITDLAGNLRQSYQVDNANGGTISVGKELSAGTYVVLVNTGGQVYNSKLIKF